MKKFLVGLVMMSGTALAQDYYVPVPKEIEDLARLPVPDLKITDDEAFYTLPQDLTGVKNEVFLKRDFSAGELPRIYRGDKADLACMGSNALPACAVTHKNIVIDPAAREKFLKEKYKNPLRLNDAMKVGSKFSSESQPLGVISKRSDFVPPAMPNVWSVEILKYNVDANNRILESLTSFGTFELNLNNMTFGESWPVSDLNRDANHISGDYRRGNSNMWFDLEVNTERTRFEGTWGFQNEPGKVHGVLKGRVK